MSLVQRKLVTIVTEAMLEQRLLKDLPQLGAHGYTVTEARGKGSRGERDASWEPSGNIRVEVVCDATVATAIAEFLWERYYSDYGMILFMSDVEVLRPEKF
jgi:nitrogen regulatory protein PII